MTRRRRQFSPEFKEEAVRMVLEGERTVTSVVREFGINASTQGSWVNRHRIASAQEERQAVSEPERAGQSYALPSTSRSCRSSRWPVASAVGHCVDSLLTSRFSAFTWGDMASSASLASARRR
ncbi:transposase [Nonomuraea sp. NPDC050786]|uniref:transposase n=1 Tax=Nonomuraea sp. NPDC050786 TaxID=3154840 RepID=UPI0033DEA2F7